MKILINYLGRTGSGPLLAYEMTKALIENGNEVTAVLSTGVTNKEDWCALKNIQVYWMQTYTDKMSLLKSTIQFLLYNRRKFKKHFSESKFDMVYSPMPHLWAGWINACFPLCRRVVTVHDPIPHSGANKIETRIITRQYQQADDLVVLTRSFVPIVQKRYKKSPDQIHLIPHGVEPSYKRKQKAPSPVHFDSEKTNFVFVGRIEDYKGLHVLSKAFSQLIALRSDVTLTIAGKGDFTPYWDEFSKLPNTTIINRYIADEEMGWFFDGPRVVIVLPYLDATQSGNVPVAMEYGCTLLASKTGGLQEQIEDGKTGILVQPGDANQLADGMLWIMEHAEQCDAMKKNYRTVLEGLQWSDLARQLVDIATDEKNEGE